MPASGSDLWPQAFRPADRTSLDHAASTNTTGDGGGAGSWSLLDLTSPTRSQVLRCLVGDILGYVGANEVNVPLYVVRIVCRELRDQIDEECLTFNYDDSCGLVEGPEDEIQLVNRCIRRHGRLKYFECLLKQPARFDALLKKLELPPGTLCSFNFEIKTSPEAIRRLFKRFHVRRLNLIPDHTGAQEEVPGGASGWSLAEPTPLHTLVLRNCTQEIATAMVSASPRLSCLQIVDSRLVSLVDMGVPATRLTSLSLTGVVTMPDDQFGRLIALCQNLRSLYISKCHVSNVKVALPRLELLSVTHCRQLTDLCATELLQPANNPALRFLDLTENRGLTSPDLAHPGVEMAWLLHCPQLTDQAVSRLFQGCSSLTAVNLVQSAVQRAFICSPALRTLELTTSQNLTDGCVTQLLEHCPSLVFLDVGHCCNLYEPTFAHATLETILLSFCVNLKEHAVSHLFENCGCLKYVELAVCMFDMARFQREYRGKVQVVVNFDF